jgi:hypothetical protein
MISKLLSRSDFTRERTESNSDLHRLHSLRIPVSDKQGINKRYVKLDKATPEAIPKSALLRVRDGDTWSSLPISTEDQKRLTTPLKRQWQVTRGTVRRNQVNRLEGH